MTEHETKQGVGIVGSGGATTVEEARALHHLASADPEFDGTMTGAAHERKYGLEREADTVAHWEAAGVDPYRNGAFVTADSDEPDEKAVPAKPKTTR